MEARRRSPGSQPSTPKRWPSPRPLRSAPSWVAFQLGLAGYWRMVLK